jgi:hypothetical protein
MARKTERTEKMASTKQNHQQCGRYSLVRALFILPLAVGLSGLSYHEARAQTQAPSCAAALDTLMSRWQSIGFAEPGKPAQMIVAGRHGYTTTRGQLNFMQQQIRAGARDCEAGRDAEALAHINTVRATLDRIGQI